MTSGVKLCWLLAALQCVAAGAIAHPVAQGAMDIAVRTDTVNIRARVSTEEAFVAEAFGGNAKALDEVWQNHGRYLLEHIRVFVNGALSAGTLISVEAPAVGGTNGYVTYGLRYSFREDQRSPVEISFQQDVLNEFSFAPGNMWEATYIVRVLQEGRTMREGLLLTHREPLVFQCETAAVTNKATPAFDATALARSFVLHGIKHILGGYDHLLFVSGLVLATISLWDLVKVVSAFTVAHTITLTLAVLDIVRIPSHFVEPMIAASIVFVAAQNLLFPKQSRGWTRIAVAFGFGLFHGLGFAGGLLGAMEGMAGIAVITAIAAFSFGVEIGHQFVALPLFAFITTMRFRRGEVITAGSPRLTLRVASGAICAAGCFYFVAALRWI